MARGKNKMEKRGFQPTGQTGGRRRRNRLNRARSYKLLPPTATSANTSQGRGFKWGGGENRTAHYSWCESPFLLTFKIKDSTNQTRQPVLTFSRSKRVTNLYFVLFV